MNVYLLGGNSTDHSIWNNVVCRLLELTNSNIQVLDLAGHGNDQRIDCVTIDEFAEEIYDLIRNEQNIVLIGLSLGGHVFYRVADLLVKNNKNLIKLFVVGSPPVSKRIDLPMYVPDITKNEYIIEALPLLTKKTLFTDEEATVFVRCQLQPKDYDANETKNAIEIAKKVSVGRHLATSLFTSTVDELVVIETITSKGVIVCIAHAIDDSAVSLPYLLQINVNMLWNSKIMLIEGSHLLPLNNPKGFSDCLIDFINS